MAGYPQNCRSSKKRLRILFFPLIALITCPQWGCRAPIPPLPKKLKFSYYRPPIAPYLGQRVALYPLRNQSSVPYAEASLLDALASEFRAAGLFEVVIVEPPRNPQCSIQHDWNSIPETVLADVARRYHVDSVIFGTLTEYHPYWPPRVGVKLHLVDAAEATVLASVDGLWDAGRQCVSEEAGRFASHLVAQDRLPHIELVLQSPRHYMQFVASQIVARFGSRVDPEKDESVSVDGQHVSTVSDAVSSPARQLHDDH